MSTEPPIRHTTSDFVQSLARGLAVIVVFDADHSRMTLTEVAQRTDTSRATARRFLLTLVELGFMGTDGKLFWLTPKILSLGYSYLSSLSLAETAEPHLVALSGLVNESTSVTVLDSGDIVYVARHSVRRVMKANIYVGTRFPAYATSMGRVLLSGLPAGELDEWLAANPLRSLTPNTVTSESELRGILDDVREKGWAMCLEELEPALCSIAVPITNRAGSVVAALNISKAGSGRQTGPELKEFLQPLLAAAQQITEDYIHVSAAA